MKSDFDPLAKETFESPHEDFRRLRSECPVAWSEAFDGFWMLTRYEDVRRALVDEAENYVTSVRNVVPGSAATRRRPPLHLDPPDHTPYRRALERALSRARVESLEPAIRRHAARLIDNFISSGEGDFVEAVSRPLPVLAFGEWMGLTPAQVETLQKATREYNLAWRNFDRAGVEHAGQQLAAIAAEIIEDRRNNLRDPAIDPTSSLLVERDAAGNRLPEELLAGCIRQVLVVGLIAPPIVLASIAMHLAKHPDLHTRLRSQPELLEPAIEEFLRLYTPYRGFARTSLKTVELNGRKICPGEAIALNYSSANRDEAVFDNPDEFVLGRSNIGKHIAFGLGPHRCVGMPVARLELIIALETLLAKIAKLEISGEPVMCGMPEVGPIEARFRVTAA